MSRYTLFMLLVGVCSLFAQTSVACKVNTQTYSANDGVVLTDTAHVITFTAECPPNVVPSYASLNGKTLVVVRSDDSKSYQISWTNELSKSSSGSYDISVFDEEGYLQFKKNQRSGSGSSSKSLFNIQYSHSSPYRGPLLQSEFIALLLGAALCYYAISLRCKIVAKKV